MDYSHTQWSKLWVLVLIFYGVIFVPIVNDADRGSTAYNLFIALFLIVLLGVVVYFSRLEVTVDDKQVVAAFGLGKPHRVIALSEIDGVSQVRNSFWYGFGVRKIHHGWMYNVWGLDAVELQLSEGKVFRIGTDDPETLLAAITLQLTR